MDKIIISITSSSLPLTPQTGLDPPLCLFPWPGQVTIPCGWVWAACEQPLRHGNHAGGGLGKGLTTTWWMRSLLLEGSSHDSDTWFITVVISKVPKTWGCGTPSKLAFLGTVLHILQPQHFSVDDFPNFPIFGWDMLVIVSWTVPSTSSFRFDFYKNKQVGFDISFFSTKVSSSFVPHKMMFTSSRRLV